MSGNTPAEPIPDFLHTLGLVPPCSIEDVKQAYLVKVKEAHPDAGGSEAQFHEVQQAFERAMQYAKFRQGRMAWLGGHVEQYALQQAVVGELERHGGVVEIEQIDWLKKSFGVDFAQLVEKVVGVAVRGPTFGDDTVAYLLSERHVLENLHWLDMSLSRITDRGAHFLATFENLRRLDLRGTHVTERSLPIIDSLQKLEWIGLPERALGIWKRWQLRYRHPDLQFARRGEICPVDAVRS